MNCDPRHVGAFLNRFHKIPKLSNRNRRRTKNRRKSQVHASRKSSPLLEDRPATASKSQRKSHTCVTLRRSVVRSVALSKRLTVFAFPLLKPARVSITKLKNRKIEKRKKLQIKIE